jgi:hypothetical protein
VAILPWLFCCKQTWLARSVHVEKANRPWKEQGISAKGGGRGVATVYNGSSIWLMKQEVQYRHLSPIVGISAKQKLWSSITSWKPAHFVIEKSLIWGWFIMVAGHLKPRMVVESWESSFPLSKMVAHRTPLPSICWKSVFENSHLVQWSREVIHFAI